MGSAGDRIGRRRILRGVRRNPRSENRKIARKTSEIVAVATEIGSRVFPFRSPAAPMPSIGTRRSTRVFVPKAAAGNSERSLRLARRLSARSGGEGDDWLRMFCGGAGGGGGGGVIACSRDDKEKAVLAFGFGWPEAVATADTDNNRDEENSNPNSNKALEFSRDNVRIVYSRKRRRPLIDMSASSSSSKDRKYGMMYSRKRPRKKPKLIALTQSSVEEAMTETGLEDMQHDDQATSEVDTVERELEMPESARNFAERAGIYASDLCTCSRDSVAIAVLVESFCGNGGSHRFSQILISLLRWMRRASVRFCDLASLFFAGSLANVFSLHGIHFLSILPTRINALSTNFVLGCGIFKIYGARQFVPQLWFDSSVLPLFFKSMHVTLLLRSQYLPGVLLRYLIDLHTNITHTAQSNEGGFSDAIVPYHVFPYVKRSKSPRFAENREPVLRKAVILHGSKLRKHQRKRSSLGHYRTRNHYSIACSFPGSSPLPQNFSVDTNCVKSTDTTFGDLFGDREEEDSTSPFELHHKYRKPNRKMPIDGTKELKAALAEVKQNIDSARCNANILVTDFDRCWREEGAEVMLEFSGSKEWCTAVKAQGITRYLHKPQDTRPCVVNRYTHSYMWPGEDGWKLEFCDRWDWYVFKELQMECIERNLLEVPVKIIPVPGVQEVSGYDEISTPFVLSDGYIRMMDDEVGRALASEAAYYDMDSGDEEWLGQLNSSSFVPENNGIGYISEGVFEKIIFTLEKDAYNHPHDIFNKERSIDLCQNLGTGDILAAVYDYWLKKRNRRRTALVKIFQGPPVKRAQLVHKPFLRKKRSFTRQRSQSCVGGRPDFFVQVNGSKSKAAACQASDLQYSAPGPNPEAVRRAEQAKSAATRALDSAIRLRSRAQLFMSNADLAAYKSSMALRIAEAKRVSESSDPASSFLD